MFDLIAITAVAFALYGVLSQFKNRRSAFDVLDDLYLDQRDLKGNRCAVREGAADQRRLAVSKSRRSGRNVLLLLLVIGALLLGFGVFIAKLSGPACAILALVGVSISYLLVERAKRQEQLHYQAELEFYLPIVMERVVMAVQAGFDVIAALHRIVELESQSSNTDAISNSKLDPVTALLYKVCALTDAGVNFRQALNQVASSSSSTAIKHAFVHLGLAHEQGGELVMPLSELSDSTQLYYQDSVEEQIAKMPVRATLPLVLTFCGLIVFFLSSPILQVMTMLSSSLSNFEGAKK